MAGRLKLLFNRGKPMKKSWGGEGYKIGRRVSSAVP